MAAKKPAPTNRRGSVPIRWDEKRQRFLLTTYDNGRKRQFFETEGEALKAWKDHCRLIQEHGRQALEYDAEAHREYEEAKRIAKGADLRDAARFYVEHYKQELSDISFYEATVQFLANKADMNLSAANVNTLKSRLKMASHYWDGVKLSSITGNHLLEFLHSRTEHGNKERTIRNYFTDLQNFFGWCVRRKLLRHSPADDIHKSDLPVVPIKPKGILTVEQATAMMHWLERNRPHLVACHAIQLFAGIRSAEAFRFRWEWVNLERKTLSLPGWSSNEEGKMIRIVKTGDDWVLYDLPDNLWLWLAKYYKSSGSITNVSSKALYKIHKHYFKRLNPPIDPWPPNALRHTFCTMLISYYSDAAKVANWSRHTNVRQLYTSYVSKLVPKEEAERFMKIVPL